MYPLTELLTYKITYCFEKQFVLQNVIELICVHAKLLQLCLTLCIPMDCNPPGSFVHGDSPGKHTEVGCHTLLQGISRLRDRTGSLRSPALADRFFISSTTWDITQQFYSYIYVCILPRIENIYLHNNLMHKFIALFAFPFLHAEVFIDLFYFYFY